MKDLKEYIKEGLADWDEGDFEKSIKKETSKQALKKIITDWIVENASPFIRIYKNKIKFDFNTDPITVDYDGNYTMRSYIDSLTNGIFQWGRINGWFDCSYCENLKSLEGTPKYVKTDFNCSYCNNLTSLEGAPEDVGLNFYCVGCILLKDLTGAPKKVEGDFTCSQCDNLKSLRGAPEEVGKRFDCSFTNIESLQYAPKTVRILTCHDCKNLKSIKGCQGKIGNFNCSNCMNLKSLKDGPEVTTFYNCSSTSIESLEGAPEKMQYGRLLCSGCKNLKSLKGCPEELEEIVLNDCTNIESFEYLPKGKNRCTLAINFAPKNYETSFIPFIPDNYKVNFRK